MPAINFRSCITSIAYGFLQSVLNFRFPSPSLLTTSTQEFPPFTNCATNPSGKLIYIASNGSAQSSYSTDGTNWSNPSAYPYPISAAYGFACSPTTGQYVMVYTIQQTSLGTPGLYSNYTYDGVNWGSPTLINQDYQDNGGYPLFGYNSSYTDLLACSSSGRFCFAGTAYSYGTNAGQKYILTSTNGINWTKTFVTTNAFVFTGIAVDYTGKWAAPARISGYPNNTYYAYYSSDGINWNTGNAMAVGSDVNGPIAANPSGGFVMVNRSNGYGDFASVTSTTGQNWVNYRKVSNYNLYTQNTITSIKVNSYGRFVAVGYARNSGYYVWIYSYSTDGINWTIPIATTDSTYVSTSNGGYSNLGLLSNQKFVAFSFIGYLPAASLSNGP